MICIPGPMKMTKISILLAPLCAALLFAGETRTWSELDYADFDKGASRKFVIDPHGLVV